MGEMAFFREMQHVLDILCRDQNSDVVLTNNYTQTPNLGTTELKLMRSISEDNRDFFFFPLWFLVNSNRVTGIYELSLCKMADTGSPGKQ